MSNKEEGKRWLNQAERDLGAAIVLMDKEFFESTCFHAQQASEKVLKSLLFLKRHRTVVTHSTRELFREVKKIIPEFKDLGRVSMEDAEKCIRYAESILAEVRNFQAK